MSNVRNCDFIKTAALLLVLMFSAGYATAQVQTVTGSLSVGEISAGQSTELTVAYTATDADGADVDTVGIGLRLHFDSSVLEMGEVANFFDDGVVGNQIQPDTDDLDGDPATDKYFLSAWSDPFSGNWPDVDTQPITLYTVPLTAISGFNGSTLNFTYSSKAAGFDFSGESVSINKIPGTVSTLSSLTASYTLNGTDTDITLSPAFDSATTDSPEKSKPAAFEEYVKLSVLPLKPLIAVNGTV